MIMPWGGLIAGVGLLAGGVNMPGGVNDAGGVPAGMVPGWLASSVESVTSMLPAQWWGWGGALQLVAALAAGYLPLLIATDSVRIYQWAAPVLALACVTVLPIWAGPVLALSIVFNPRRGPGT
jgi:hypothetical protein